MMAYWVDEVRVKTVTKPKFGRIRLKLNKLILLIYSTELDAATCAPSKVKAHDRGKKDE